MGGVSDAYKMGEASQIAEIGICHVFAEMALGKAMIASHLVWEAGTRAGDYPRSFPGYNHDFDDMINSMIGRNYLAVADDECSVFLTEDGIRLTEMYCEWLGITPAWKQIVSAVEPA